MATETRARFNKMYVPGLFMVGTDSFKRHGEDWRKLITTRKSTRAYEEETFMSGLSLLAEKPEGTGIGYDARIQGPSKKWVHKVYALGVRITEEAIDDDLYGKMSGIMAELGRSAAETINVQVFDIFNSTTKTAADGQVIFSASHTRLDGSTYSNLYTATSLSLDALQDDIAAYEALRDHRGKIVNRTGGVRLILANPALEWKLKEIFGSTDKPYTSDNTINALKAARSNLTYLCSPYVTSTTARYYIGPKDQVRGPIFFSRKPVTFAREGDFETGDALFKVSVRFSCEVCDPMNISKNAGA